MYFLVYPFLSDMRKHKSHSSVYQRRKVVPVSESFTHQVLMVVSAIPRGKTMTYREVALLAGNPKAVRAVGSIMRKNYRSDVPCHRVIRSDGTLGEYNRGGTERKQKLLREEGVVGGIVNSPVFS